MNFVAIDFETATSKRASACSVALTVVRDDQVVDEFYSLINPETSFNWRNVQVHGIHQRDVAKAPTFPEVWEIIKPFFRPHRLVIAHNNRFDNSVLKKSIERYELPVPHYQTLDTVKTSRKFYPEFPNHKLNTVSEQLGIDLQHHHNALADSQACAQILLTEARQFGVPALQPFITNV
ncbi:3'-5' exonuclease [Fructilactobacillus myrtifloralis]|uniref:3'-5' exonuclease n=1 Tax=Fructilactobacillus myrtifloralis TaxID=2940301 RepID=A0ABY5BN08_9LACO|nr:3'-5' exonuclease [Fructilactobacillus myrtifloralis]USS84980.1 3'-5' exonuclease [Fructilactobacillus myrtifloralis]